MLFNSLPFAIFLPIVLFVYYCLSFRAQNIWLVLASWFFYAWWDPRLLILVLITTSLNFFSGLGINHSQNSRQRKFYLLLGIVGNLLMLGFFKYFNFFLDSAATIGLVVGLKLSIPFLRIALPIGISFYTFQSLSYIIDLYQEKIPICKNFITFALYVSYFPLLVSGPIMSPSKIIPALENTRVVTWTWIREGLLLILIGLFKKVGIADDLAPQVSLAFQNASTLAGKDLLFSLYLFAVQIYCDFSGYSDIARGVSKLFGIDLMINFNQPYFSASFTDFWRRWHISLSTWFRTYVFIPLEFARKRQKSLRQESNLFIVFLLTGLWHGANWTYVVWGGLHGLFLSIERPFLTLWKKRIHWLIPGWLEKITGFIQILITFNLVCLTWIFFRAENFTTAWNYLVGILTWRINGNIVILTANNLLRFSILFIVLLIIDIVQARTKDHTAMLKWPWLARSVFYAILLILLITLGGLDAQTPFFYFQF